MILRNFGVATLGLALFGCGTGEAATGSSGDEEIGETQSSADESGSEQGTSAADTSTTNTDSSSETNTDSSSETNTDSSSETTDTGGDPGFGPWCDPPPACDDPPPPPGEELGWDHLDSNVIVLAGSPNHRIRDQFYVPGETQWLLGKFSYGDIDKDMKDELVDVYVQRDCAGPWQLLGSSKTTEDGAHPTVEGVEDSGGWVYFPIPDAEALVPGRHRVHMVLRGDATTASGFVEVVEPGTPIFLSDVDGTLTTYETEEFVALLSGEIPAANEFAATALGILQDKGYHAMYLTARPEWLVERTREFVETRGFPPGIIHTTLSFEGALGGTAEAYKTGELQMLMNKGLVPTWVFGNTDSDAAAYDNAGIQPLDHRVFFQFDDPHGGRTIQSYGDLIDEFEALPDLCR
ncbi:phosphatidylinositol transfer protein [Nannocystaceae bacterium ST9]